MSEHTEQNDYISLALHYTRALFRWVKAGRPKREEREIREIFDTYCWHCDDFEERNSSCGHCGCRVNLSKSAPSNKLAMATEHCPLDKW